MEPLLVLIADDHALFRDGLRALFLSTPEIEVVGEATTGEEAIALSATLQPDVVLMDIEMPDINGIEATREIVRTSPHIGVLMVTMFEDDALIFAAMRAGAHGYVLKRAKYVEMLRAIHAVGSGEAIFSPAIAARLMEFFSSMQHARPPELFPKLSERERETLLLMVRGRKNAQIATELSLSAKTVRNYVSNILSKLQLADRTEAIIRAKEAGMG